MSAKGCPIYRTDTLWGHTLLGVSRTPLGHPADTLGVWSCFAPICDPPDLRSLASTSRFEDTPIPNDTGRVLRLEETDRRRLHLPTAVTGDSFAQCFCRELAGRLDCPGHRFGELLHAQLVARTDDLEQCLGRLLARAAQLAYASVCEARRRKRRQGSVGEGPEGGLGAQLCRRRRSGVHPYLWVSGVVEY